MPPTMDRIGDLKGIIPATELKPELSA